jgi:hypothetical protein
MNVAHLKPNAPVAAHVERILVIDDHQILTSFSLPLFANGTPTLLFISKKGTVKGKATGHLMLFGQTILPELLTFTDNFTLIAYFFKPFALLSLFGVAAHELTDRIIDLNLLSPQITTELQERLLNTGNTQNQLALLDGYIEDLIARQKIDSGIVAYTTQAIMTSPGKEVLMRLQRELNISERTFQRTFQKKRWCDAKYIPPCLPV